MKEKDLEKCLDNLIINGLIQEAEQDNTEFEVAMRKMSDEDFLALIYDTVEDNTKPSLNFNKDIIYDKEKHKDITAAVSCCASEGFADNSYEDWDERDAPQSSKSIIRMPAQNGWKIWAAAIASVAAILLIVLVPAHMDMNSRLCESALVASATYMPPSRGGDDIVTMPKEEVKALLPELKMQYSASLKKEEGVRYMKTPEEKEYYNLISNPEEAGMELIQAYLRLNKKEKAIEVLRQLSDKYKDSEFGEHCNKLLEILE